MAKLRCERISSRPPMGGLASSVGIATLEKVGPGNTEVTPGGASAIAFGPAAEEMDIYVRNFGGQVYVTKGSGTPVASSSSGTLLNDKDYLPVHLFTGESIAVVTANVA